MTDKLSLMNSPLFLARSGYFLCTRNGFDIALKSFISMLSVSYWNHLHSFHPASVLLIKNPGLCWILAFRCLDKLRIGCIFSATMPCDYDCWINVLFSSNLQAFIPSREVTNIFTGSNYDKLQDGPDAVDTEGPIFCCATHKGHNDLFAR